jgi:hypothetical protein
MLEFVDFFSSVPIQELENVYYLPLKCLKITFCDISQNFDSQICE